MVTPYQQYKAMMPFYRPRLRFSDETLARWRQERKERLHKISGENWMLLCGLCPQCGESHNLGEDDSNPYHRLCLSCDIPF